MTWAKKVVNVLDSLPQPRPFTRWNITDWLGVQLPDPTIGRVMAALRSAGCIRPVGGGGPKPLMYERVPGVPAPDDGRGGSTPRGLEALERGRALRLKASRGFVMRWKK